MANSIALVTRYLPLLDEVYKAESKTAILDAANGQVQFVNANTVKLYQISTPGLGAYSRSTGFPDGDVTGTWETFTLSQDRGRSFQIDAMDEDETLDLTVGATLGQFIRSKVVPEVDQYRFAKYAAAAKNSATATITSGTTDIPDLIAEGQQAMGDAEVPEEGRILFVSELCYRALKAKITRYLANENGVNRNVEVFDDMRVIRVPAGRFNTGATIGEDGYTQTGVGINFMIVHPSAVAQVVKHEVPRLFAPDVNQDADAWKVQYRIYHDAFTLEHGTAQAEGATGATSGIYLHKAGA